MRPFYVIPNIVKGMTNMNIHPDFLHKDILTFVADLIFKYDYKDFDDLSEGDKFEFAAHLIKAAGRDGEWEFATEHAFSDLLMNYFKTCLVMPSTENKEKFINCAMDHAVEYYEYTMKAIFNSVYLDYEQSKSDWLNHVSKYGDPDEYYDRYRESLSL